MEIRSFMSMIISDSSTDAGSNIEAPSSLADTVPADTPVGLSDPQYVAKKRQMLDAVNHLRAMGAHLDLDIPVIGVLGSQSAGKSSLIEAISGITLPRAAGTCTRCPTECQLSRSPEPWRCVVSLRFVKDEDGRVLSKPNEIKFGDPIFSKSLVTERIRRAQSAILNPDTSYLHFLDASPDELEERQISFSSNSICLQISGRDVEDLSFVDLPGLIVGGEPREARFVQQLAEEHISRESCITLVTVACETDFENQSAHLLAAQFDSYGARTIGVLTKPDRIPLGEEATWISKIQSGDRAGGIEFFSVKNPDSQEIRNGITYEQAREREAEFFATRAPWSNLEWLYQRRLGTDKLTRRLCDLLDGLIARRLPELQEELDKLLEQTNHEIARLPKPPSSEPVAEILDLITDFVRSVEDLVGGSPDENGLIQTLREPRVHFRKAIRQTAPDFRPLERPNDVRATPDLPPPTFLSSEEAEEDNERSDPSKAIFVGDVMKTANSAVTRELPNNFPYIIIKKYIGSFVGKWDLPSQLYFDFVKKELSGRVKLLVETHFSQYAHGHLKQAVMNIVQNHIQGCADAAGRHIAALLEDEHEPFTMNEHYYLEYRANFFAYYKGARMRAKSNFIRNLEDHRDQDMVTALNEAMSSLTRMGLHGVNASSLASLLPPDPMEPAVGIMADVRAYFQIAYKRFVDNVPMGIDRAMLRGMTAGLKEVLLKGLAISGPDGYQRCRTLLSEPEDTVERRSELHKKRQRLVSARKELVDAFM